MIQRAAFCLFMGCLVALSFPALRAEDVADLPKAAIDGNGPGWVALSLADFDNVNGNEDTWSEKEGVIHCTGQPVGVTRSKKKYTNFELVAQWRHLKSAGNSG